MLPFESESMMCHGDRIIVSHHLSSLSFLSFFFSGQGASRLFLALPRKVTLPYVCLILCRLFFLFTDDSYSIICSNSYTLVLILILALFSVFSVSSSSLSVPSILSFFRTSATTRGVVKFSLHFCVPTFRLFLLSFLVRLFFLSQRPSWVLLGWSTKH